MKAFDLEPALAGALTFVIVILGDIKYANSRRKNRYKLLEDDLDPEAFIQATEKQIKIVAKNKRSKTILNADLALGLMDMGKYEEALNTLNQIDKRYLSKWNGSLLIYYSNLMSLYTNIGEIEKAIEIYEDKIKNYPIRILTESMTMDIVLANKSFYGKEYNTSKEFFHKVLNNNKSRRLKVQIYYILANIAEQDGNLEEAIIKYKIVGDKGNKLYASYLAKEKLKVLQH